MVRPSQKVILHPAAVDALDLASTLQMMREKAISMPLERMLGGFGGFGYL